MAALPVFLPRQPSVVGTLFFLLDEAVRMCVYVRVGVRACACVYFIYPISSPVTASSLHTPKYSLSQVSTPLPDQTYKGHLQRMKLLGTSEAILPIIWV